MQRINGQIILLFVAKSCRVYQQHTLLASGFITLQYQQQPKSYTPNAGSPLTINKPTMWSDRVRLFLKQQTNLKCQLRIEEESLISSALSFLESKAINKRQGKTNDRRKNHGVGASDMSGTASLVVAAGGCVVFGIVVASLGSGCHEAACDVVGLAVVAGEGLG